MKEIKVTKYIADDGKEFDTKEVCVDYENTVLNYRRLIDCFNIFDPNLNMLAKPDYLWSCDPEKLTKELNEDPILKDFDFSVIDEQAQYIVFKNISDEQYQEIRDSFGFLSDEMGMGDFVFPNELGNKGIIYYTGEEWKNCDSALKEAKEFFDACKLLEAYGGKNE